MPPPQLRSLIDELESEPEIPENPSEEEIRVWRLRIDRIDGGLLELLNERSRAANVIGLLKKRLGLPVYVPTREEEVIGLVLEANGGPLPDASVKRLFERIIDETRSLERQKYQVDSDKK